MKTKHETIPTDVLDVLRRSTLDGPNLRLPDQLDRKLYTRTNDVLTALGGAWNRKAKAHVFAGDARAVLGPALDAGAYEPETSLDYFPTPDALADELVAGVGDLPPRPRILEPSAGDGALVRAIYRRWPDADVSAVEVNRRHEMALTESLQGRGCIVFKDFLAIEMAPFFDAVIGNPPFSRGVAERHTLHALACLAPGGHLAHLLPEGVRFRSDKAAVELRARVEAWGGAFTENPPGSFRASGTDVRSVTLHVRRPA